MDILASDREPYDNSPRTDDGTAPVDALTVLAAALSDEANPYRAGLLQGRGALLSRPSDGWIGTAYEGLRTHRIRDADSPPRTLPAAHVPRRGQWRPG